MSVMRDVATGKLFGVHAEAREQKVTPGHLWLVLNGKRVSKRLMDRVDVIEFDSRKKKASQGTERAR